jgi:hypothetical protein
MLNTFTCQHCEVVLPQPQRGRPKRYCSDKCRKAAQRDISVAIPENVLRYRRGRLAGSQPVEISKEICPENRLPPKRNLIVERVNEETFKVTNGETSRVSASHGQWGGFNTTRALAWIIRAAPNAWLARCGNQACGPSSFNKAKASALEMASGAIGDYFVGDPVRELNELQSDPSLDYKPPKREVTPDGDNGLGGKGR